MAGVYMVRSSNRVQSAARTGNAWTRHRSRSESARVSGMCSHMLEAAAAAAATAGATCMPAPGSDSCACKRVSIITNPTTAQSSYTYTILHISSLRGILGALANAIPLMMLNLMFIFPIGCTDKAILSCTCYRRCPRRMAHVCRTGFSQDRINSSRLLLLLSLLKQASPNTALLPKTTTFTSPALPVQAAPVECTSMKLGVQILPT